MKHRCDGFVEVVARDQPVAQLGGSIVGEIRQCRICGQKSYGGSIKAADPPQQPARPNVGKVPRLASGASREISLLSALILFLALLFPALAAGATPRSILFGLTSPRYFVGNGTNWSSTASWSTTDGGASGASVPGSGNDVLFTALSPGNCAIDVQPICLSLDCTGFTKTITSVGTTMNINGPMFKLSAGMGAWPTACAVAFTQTTTGTVAITTAGKTLGNVTTDSTSAASTATYQLQDATTLTSGSTWTHNGGGLDTNNQALSTGAFLSSTGITRSITPGSSSITITGGGGNAFNINGALLTWTPGTSTITFTGASQTFQTGPTGRTFNALVFAGSGTTTLTGGAAHTVGTMTFTGSANLTDVVIVQDTFTVTGALTVTSNSSVNRLLVRSATVGTPQTITAASLVCSNVIDWMDITGAGAATWTTGASGASAFGDCGGNSGITMTASATQTYSANTTGNWSTVAWSGAGGVTRVPLPQDDVVISGLTSATLTGDMPRWGRSISFAGSTGGTFNNFQVAPWMFGSLTFPAGVAATTASNINFMGRGAFTYTPPTNAGSQGINLNAPGGSLTLQADYTGGIRVVQVSLGTFDANNRNMGFGQLNVSNTGSATLTMGSGNWTFASASGGGWSVGASATLNAGTSTITMPASNAAYTFAGGGKIYYNLTIPAGQGSVTITSANTFNGTLSISPQRPVVLPASTVQAAASLVATGQTNGYLSLPGPTAGNNQNATTPDSAANSITGDLTIDVKLAAVNWQASGTNEFLSKIPASGNNAWDFWHTSGFLTFRASANGTALTQYQCGTAIASAGGTVLWVRVSFQINNGTNSVAKFYTSPDGVAWTQIGTNVTGAILASIFDSTGVMEIGSGVGGQSELAGNFYRAKLYNSALASGSGTPVFDADFTTKPFGANTFAESSTNAATVTINGAAARAGDGRVDLSSSTPGTQATISVAAGTPTMQYVVAKDINAQGGATFVDTNGVNNGNNTGITFQYPVSPSGTITLGGSNTEAKKYLDSGSGSIVSGGSRAEAFTARVSPSGAIVSGGSATSSTAFRFSPDTTMLLGGTTVESEGETSSPTGSTVLGGSLLDSLLRRTSPTGSGVLGGSLASVYGKQDAPSGSISSTGTAPNVLMRHDSPSGVLHLGGASTDRKTGSDALHGAVVSSGALSDRFDIWTRTDVELTAGVVTRVTLVADVATRVGLAEAKLTRVDLNTGKVTRVDVDSTRATLVDITAQEKT
jgi:hypothetical protein